MTQTQQFLNGPARLGEPLQAEFNPFEFESAEPTVMEVMVESGDAKNILKTIAIAAGIVIVLAWRRSLEPTLEQVPGLDGLDGQKSKRKSSKRSKKSKSIKI